MAARLMGETMRRRIAAFLAVLGLVTGVTLATSPAAHAAVCPSGTFSTCFNDFAQDYWYPPPGHGTGGSGFYQSFCDAHPGHAGFASSQVFVAQHLGPTYQIEAGVVGTFAWDSGARYGFQRARLWTISYGQTDWVLRFDTGGTNHNYDHDTAYYTEGVSLANPQLTQKVKWAVWYFSATSGQQFNCETPVVTLNQGNVFGAGGTQNHP